MINPANVARVGGFGRSGEFVFFVMLGASSPGKVILDREWVSSKGRTHTGNIRWDLLKRSGTNAERHHSPGGFYPIYINPLNGKIEAIGDPLARDTSEAPKMEGLYALLPIRQNGTEGNWQWSKDTFVHRMQQGRVKIGGNSERGFTVYILKDGEYTKVVNGGFPVVGHGINNELLTDEIDASVISAIPGDIWKISSHDATQYGSRLLGNILVEKRFTFPKSLYATHDAIRFFVANKPNALILDFFAGSGTTLHAVNLLNAEDGGHRRCIMVTNNEVSDDEAKSLRKQGFQPGDDEWERLGIAHYVNWPRTVCSIKGVDINGSPLKGNYFGSDIPMADGFKANAIFFKLGFLSKNSVALGRQFRELLPVLWMKAGAIGPCPKMTDDNLPSWLILPENKMAVLIDDNEYHAFKEEMEKVGDIDTLYIITDFEREYTIMANELGVANTFQLYRDYLDNFRINHSR